MKKITRYISQLINTIIPNGPAQSRAAPHQVSLHHSSTSFSSPSFPTRPDFRSNGSLVNYARRCIGKKKTIETLEINRRHYLIKKLPDDVLLAIFDFCVDENGRTKESIEAWQTLVHVCRQWRRVVFASPRRLHLQLVCAAKTPARDTLDVWPALPLVVRCNEEYPSNRIENVDNIVAVLEHSSRVCQIYLSGVSGSDLEEVSAAIQEPFPELTHLVLSWNRETMPVLPNSFLGGSAPRLQLLYLRGIPFPGLPNLLLSTTHLVDLSLFDIPHSGYFSPEAMAPALSRLTSLEELRLQFKSPRSCPDQTSRRPPLLTRFILPALTYFRFKGVGEYLDDLVARIDAPRLIKLHITFFNQILFDTPQLIQFIGRTPMLEALKKTRVIFENDAARVELYSSPPSDQAELRVKIPCTELDWQVSSLEQVFTWCLPPLSKLEDLYIYGHSMWRQAKQDNIENTLWLELLRPFTSAKNLYLSAEFARRIVPALQQLAGGGTTETVPTSQVLLEGGMSELLPSLQNIFLEGFQTSPLREGIRQFIATRQANRPIAISQWYRI